MNQGTQFWGTKSRPLASPWSWFRWAGGRVETSPSFNCQNHKATTTKQRIWGKIWKSVGLHLADSVGEGMTWYESPSRPIGRRSLEVPVPSGCKFHHASCSMFWSTPSRVWSWRQVSNARLRPRTGETTWASKSWANTSIGDMKYSINI